MASAPNRCGSGSRASNLRDGFQKTTLTSIYLGSRTFRRQTWEIYPAGENLAMIADDEFARYFEMLGIIHKLGKMGVVISLPFEPGEPAHRSQGDRFFEGMRRCTR